MREIINVQNVDGKLLVSSLDVSKNFNKEHKHVLEKIDTKRKELNKSVENSADIKNLKVFFLDNFLEDCYIDDKGREQRQILLTRDGFSFITMGFTGIKADAWKLKYIEVFNKMEQQLRQKKQLSPMEQLKLQYEVLEQHEQRFEKIEERLDSLEINPHQKRAIQRAKNKRVTGLLGGRKSAAYKDASLRSKVYADMGRQYNNYFDISEYAYTPRNRFKEALELISTYNLTVELSMEVKQKNNQLAFA